MYNTYATSVPYSTYPTYSSYTTNPVDMEYQTSYTTSEDGDRFFGGALLAPFLLGGIAGAAAAPYFYRPCCPPPYPYPAPYYPSYPYPRYY